MKSKELQYSSEFSALAEDADVSAFENLAPLAKLFWKEETVQKAYLALPQNSLPETNAFFMSKIDSIHHKDYTPSNEDILKLRFETHNVNETVFKIEGFNFKYCTASTIF